MIKYKHAQMLLITFLMIKHVLANGGPVSHLASPKIGEIVFTNHYSVEVINEELLFTIKNNTVYVDVKYDLFNKSREIQKLYYAFPVDVFCGFESESPETLLNDLKFEVNQKTLRYDKRIFYSTENGILPGEEFAFQSPDDNGFTKRVWFTTKFDLKAESGNSLHIKYNFKTGCEDISNNIYSEQRSQIPSYRSGEIHWDFTPAAYFGNGKAKKMKIRVDAGSVLQKGGDINFNGIKFAKNAKFYEYQEDNFDFNKNKNLQISYNYQTFLLNQYLIKNGYSLVDSIKASTQLSKDYSAEKVIDGDFASAWAEGSVGFGKGDYLELTFKRKVNVMLFVLVPGYTKSIETYNANNRIKEIEMEIFYYGYGNGAKLEKISKTISYPDEKFRPELPGNIDFKNMLFEFGNYGYSTFNAQEQIDSIVKLKLIIKDVYKGNKYDDACISEVLFIPQTY